MEIGLAVDDGQGLSDSEQLRVVEHGAALGYQSAWTPSRADSIAFDRCISWHAATGLPVGISAVPASGQPATFYAEHARRAWEATQGRFTLVVGSGTATRPAEFVRRYLKELRSLLPAPMSVYVAALGPRMLDLAAQDADGVALNWCTAPQVEWSRQRVIESAQAAGRAAPRVIEYIRTCVDPDERVARRTVASAARGYALGPLAYRRHFERMGFAQELQRLEQSPDGAPDSSLSTVGAAGPPGATKPRFDELAGGLDLAIVRILTVKGDEPGSARRALEECRPR